MAFDWSKYKEAAPEEETGGGFSWDQYEEEKPEKPQTTVAEAAAHSAAEGATFGQGSNAAAALEYLLGKGTDLFRRKGEKLYEGKDVVDLAEENEAILQKGKEEHPVVSAVAETVGGLAPTAPLTALNAAKTAVLAGKLAKAGRAGQLAAKALPVATQAAQGAVESGVRAASEGGDILESAKGGAVFGAGGEVLGTLAGKVPGLLKAGGKYAKDVAEEMGVKTLGFSPTKMRRMATNEDLLGEAKKVARMAMDEGIITKPVTAHMMHKKTTRILEKVAQPMKSAYRQADKALGEGLFTPAELKSYVRDTLFKSDKFPDASAIAQVDAELSNLMTRIKPDQKLGFEDMWDFAKKLDQKTNQWERASDAALESAADMMNKASVAMRDANYFFINEVNPSLAGTIRETNSVYGKLAQARTALKNTALRDFSKNVSIPRTRGMIESVVERGAFPIRAGATGAIDTVSKGLQKMASGTSKFAPILREASKRGGHSLAATHYTMMQRDDDYRRAYEGAASGEE